MEIVLPKIKVNKKEDNYGEIIIAPLQTGYGITVGNSLRRILLSSLAGAAVKTVSIEGVDHEFSTIAGVKEDVLQIILAIKKLGIRYDSDDEVELVIKEKGPSKVTAKSIQAPGNVEITNPDLHIATLKKSGELFARLLVDKGIGYISAEERGNEDKSIGEIAIDANYAPIEHVNYEIGQTRVGGTTDYDELKLEITTDGSVDPEKALQQAAKILKRHFEIVHNLEEEIDEKIDAEIRQTSEDEKQAKKSEQKSQKSKQDKQEDKKKEKKVKNITRKTPIEETNLSSRTTNVLDSNNVRTVGGLARYNPDTLKEMEGLGPKSVKEIEEKLNKWGIE